MAKLVSVFISEAHRRVIAILTWLACFVLLIGAGGWLVVQQTGETMEAEARIVGEHFIRLRANLLDTFEAMHGELTATPCTPAFNEQLRRIAYRPDGLNEFLYAPDGIAQCSVRPEALAEPVPLGPPDIKATEKGRTSFWIDRDLSFLGLQGQIGTIALNGAFAAIVPAQHVAMHTPAWLSLEVVLTARDGRHWHRSGKPDLFSSASAQGGSLLRAVAGGKLYSTFCDPQGLHCIVGEGDMPALLADNPAPLAGGLLVAAVLAGVGSSLVGRTIRRHWAFEARFRRHLDERSIVCAYQPVMSLQSREIMGCEVLARWRDVDDQIVFPDRFVPLVEKHDLTMRFTELVARRAFEELSAALPPGRRIQVNFNIFPRDLDASRLARVYAGFLSQPERFDVVLEIIESDEIPAGAQREIEQLRRLGIKTYIDDFGTGYSNMQNLAALSVDGVKLDRAFAMAPDNSMMAQMLRHAVEMIQATGRVMVIEGVETAERLEFLRGMQARIDFVQGYFISRPLDIEGFALFLERTAVPDEPRAKLSIVAA